MNILPGLPGDTVPVCSHHGSQADESPPRSRKGTVPPDCLDPSSIQARETLRAASVSLLELRHVPRCTVLFWALLAEMGSTRCLPSRFCGGLGRLQNSDADAPEIDLDPGPGPGVGGPTSPFIPRRSSAQSSWLLRGVGPCGGERSGGPKDRMPPAGV
jgi:hypothetical protein